MGSQTAKNWYYQNIDFRFDKNIYFQWIWLDVCHESISTKQNTKGATVCIEDKINLLSLS